MIDSSTLILLVIVVGPMLLESALSRYAPRRLASFAWIPVGAPRVVQCHASHVLGDVPASPASYRKAARAKPEPIEANAFPIEKANEQVRLVPLEGADSAILVSTRPWHGAEASARIDAQRGPGQRIVLRARVTPFVFLAVPLAAAFTMLLWGRTSVFFLCLLLVGSGRTFFGTRRAITWALDTTEERLVSKRKREAGREDDEVEHHEEATAARKLTKKRKRVFLDAEEGKETAITLNRGDAEPPAPPRTGRGDAT